MSVDFTIVTPSYGYGQFIGECLESVMKQEGVTFEHLVYDAGSKDDTAEVVARFKAVKFVQEADRGMCHAINKGFAVAQGKWVMWLNADDRLKPGALKAVLEHAEAHENADVIYGGWDFVDRNGRVTRKMTIFPFRERMLNYLGCYLGSTATFYRNESVIKRGRFKILVLTLRLSVKAGGIEPIKWSSGKARPFLDAPFHQSINCAVRLWGSTEAK